MRSSLVGRTRELASLAETRSPFVTLWGPGGVGKTTLARAHVDREAKRGASVVWVDLAAARSARDVLGAIATALGSALEPSREDEDSVLAIAITARAQRALVVADNAEQLDASARRVLSRFASEGARLLVTSREALDVEGEHAVPVGPLDTEEAVALFDLRAGVDVARDLARAIVVRLDALPLAIELAAARVPILGAADLLARLDRKLDLLREADAERSARPDRHATLRAAIAWSWDLLDLPDREALMACAIFEAPFDAALAESILDRRPAFGAESDALDRLERLRARALLLAEPGPDGERPRLRVLEAVRDFARERLAESDHARTLLTRHATAVAERCLPHAEAVARGAALPSELSRRRSDLDAASRRVDIAPNAGSRATLALAALLSVTGPVDDAIARCRECLRVLDTETDDGRALGARLLVAVAGAERAASDLASAAKTIAEAKSLVVDDAPEILADVYRTAGSIARSSGDLGAALDAWRDALAFARAAGDRAREGLCLCELGAVHQSQGRLALARERFAEAIAIHAATKCRRAEGIARSFFAVATHRGGDPAAAIPLHEAALAIHREVGHRRLEGAELLHLGYVHHELASHVAARARFEEARHVLTTCGARGLEALALVLTAQLDIDVGDGAAARLHLAEATRLAPKAWPRLAATMKLAWGHLALSEGDHDAAIASYESAATSCTDVEIGFEALTPAWLAVAILKTGGDPARAKRSFDDARERASGFENPHLGVALAILESSPTESGESLARVARTSSAVRRALAFTLPRRSLEIRDAGRLVVLPDGTKVDLGRRKNVRLVLDALVGARRSLPGAPVSADTLVRAGWPGERMRAEAATKRLHTAIWTLRKLGFEEILRTSEEGYFLDPNIKLSL